MIDGDTTPLECLPHRPEYVDLCLTVGPAASVLDVGLKSHMYWSLLNLDTVVVCLRENAETAAPRQCSSIKFVQ